MRHEVPAARVYEMAATKEFQEQKCRDAGATCFVVTVTERDAGATVVTRRTLPTAGFPALLHRFVPTGVTSTETITWAAAGPGGARIADLAVAFHGLPAALHGQIRLLPDGRDRATIVVDAEFRAHVPVIGRKVEGFAAPIILGVIDAEERTGRAWAAAGGW
ncbi:MAG: DUF2505 domain-containing protein [Jatrophihabitans sp.]|nr:MAG: DUF2505 domain-containing protein [Jatrophihabitans sp.]